MNAHIAIGLSVGLTLATFTAPAAMAQSPAQTSGPIVAADNITITSGIDSVSEYVFRGVSLGGQSLQPYTEIGVGGLTVGAWYSVGFGGGSEVQADELDLYASYSLPLQGAVGIDVGATYYHYPQTGALFDTDGGNAGTYEVFASASYGEWAFAPTATVYYDTTLEALTLEGSVGYSWETARPDWSVDAGLTAGHVEADGPGDYQWATATVGLSKAITDAVAGIAVAGTDKSSLFWVGSGISTSF